MTPEVKAKWVAALRSGEYQQGTGSLRPTEDTYCCLGVLCDLAVKEGVIPEPVFGWDERACKALWRYGVDAPQQGDEGWHEIDGSLLPAAVVRWAGLTQSTPWLEIENSDGGHTSVELAAENDHGTPFTKIADLIEEHL